MKNKFLICALLGPLSVMADGPATISHAGDMNVVYQAVLNQLKKDGFGIDSASRDAGIKTTVVVTGGYRQTGTYLEVTFIAEGDSQTTARVTVYEEKRYKALMTEPWSTPKVNDKKSRDEAATLKQQLGW
jgi:hypothetical protein